MVLRLSLEIQQHLSGFVLYVCAVNDIGIEFEQL